MGSAVALAGLVLKATVSPELDIDAVLKVAGFIVLVFAPVDVSLVLQNLVKGGKA